MRCARATDCAAPWQQALQAVAQPVCSGKAQAAAWNACRVVTAEALQAQGCWTVLMSAGAAAEAALSECAAKLSAAAAHLLENVQPQPFLRVTVVGVDE